MPANGKRPISRRTMLTLVGAGSAASLAGCMGAGPGGGGGSGGGSGGGGSGDGGSGGSNAFAKEMGKLDFGANWEKRRLASLDEWPMAKRTKIPSGDALYTAKGWIDTESVKSATWQPPDGWKDTVASEVDTLQVLNYGDMQFDPATAAVDALFEDRTGISVERVQVVVDQAIPKVAASLSSKQKKPHLLQSTVDTSMTTYAQNGWLEPVNMIMPDEAMWKPYLPLAKQTFNWDGKLWGGPANLEGNPVHVRPDLLAEQGIAKSVIEKIRSGQWTWDDLETVMKAFKGTGTFAWGYRGSSLTYTERDWRILWYQTGGQYLQDGGKVAVNANGGGLAALKKMIEWKDKGWVPPAVTNWTQGDLSDGFLSGNLAMVPVATDLFADASEKFTLDEQYFLAPPPKANVGPSPQHATWGGGPVLATNTYAPTPEKVAGTLLQDARFSLEAGWWEYVVESNMAYPTEAYSQATETDSVKYSEVRRKTMEVAKNEVFPQQRAIMQTVSEELQVAIAGDKKPERALKDAQEFIDTVLSQ